MSIMDSGRVRGAVLRNRGRYGIRIRLPGLPGTLRCLLFRRSCRLLLGGLLLVVWAGACRPLPPIGEEFPPLPRPGAEGHLPVPSESPPWVPEVPADPEAASVPRYSLELLDVPVREVLFGLAREGGLELDLHPEVSGLVTLSARDRPLPVLLERIASSASIRCELRSGRLWAAPDEPYLRTYQVGYPHLMRETAGEVRVATEISSPGGAGAGGSAGQGNNSLTTVRQASVHSFWEQFEERLKLFLEAQARGREEEIAVSVEPLAGLLAVRARERDHRVLAAYLDELSDSLRRQVLIRVTILEVLRSRQRQVGLDLDLRRSGSGLEVRLEDLAPAGGLLGSYLLRYRKLSADGDALAITLQLLRQLGEVRVLSSPRLMVLNNQTAVLKVVDNLVYFTISQQSTLSVQGSSTSSSSSTAHTVPVGIVMSVTPQIDADGGVQLSIRPSVSRVNRYVADPNPALREAGNRVPEIQVREMESVLRLRDGEVALLGGLVQDAWEDAERGPAGLERIPLLGRLFGTRSRDRRSSELLILLSPSYRPAREQRPATRGTEEGAGVVPGEGAGVPGVGAGEWF